MESHQALKSVLKKFGYWIPNLKMVLVKHFHSDHSGSAYGLEADGPRTVAVHHLPQ